MRPQFLGAFAAMVVFARVEGSTGNLGDGDSVGLRGAEGTAEISGGKDSGAITTAGEIRRRLITTSTDVGEVITMAPTSTPTLQGSVCDNGIPGIQTGDACCLAECGQCGGSNCHLFGGGLGERNCCQSDIEDGGELCSVAGVAPCVVDDAPTPAPGLPTPPPAVAPTPAPTLAPVLALTPAPTPSPGVGPTPTPTTAPVVSPTPTPTTTPISPAGPYGFVACRVDDRRDRVMSVGPIVKSVMSAEICFGLCVEDDPSYNYFGTQYGSECFCSNTLEDSPDSSRCDFPCASITTGEICGGFDAISVYEIEKAPTPAPVTAITPEGPYESIGCRTDDRNDRVMSVGPIVKSAMSAQICFGICLDEGSSYNYFGTQYGSECFCSKHLQDSPDSNRCDFPCASIGTGEICGGFDAISVYQYGEGSDNNNDDGGDSSDRFTSLGCFEDLRDGRRAMESKMTDQSTTEMSAEICYDICVGEGANYFGLQWSFECWCSNTFSETSSAVCDMPCIGNFGEICGGFDAIEAFSIDQDGN